MMTGGLFPVDPPLARNSTAHDYITQKHDIEWEMYEEDQRFRAWLNALAPAEQKRVLFLMERQARVESVVAIRTSRYMNKNYADIKALRSKFWKQRMAGNLSKDDYQHLLKLDRQWDAKWREVREMYLKRIETRTANARARQVAGVVATA